MEELFSSSKKKIESAVLSFSEKRRGKFQTNRTFLFKFGNKCVKLIYFTIWINRMNQSKNPLYFNKIIIVLPEPVCQICKGNLLSGWQYIRKNRFFIPAFRKPVNGSERPAENEIFCVKLRFALDKSRNTEYITWCSASREQDLRVRCRNKNSNNE